MLTLIRFRYGETLEVGDVAPSRIVTTDDVAAVERELAAASTSVVVIGKDAPAEEVSAIRRAVLGKRACFIIARVNDTPAIIARLVRHGIRRLTE